MGVFLWLGRIILARGVGTRYPFGDLIKRLLNFGLKVNLSDIVQSYLVIIIGLVIDNGCLVVKWTFGR